MNSRNTKMLLLACATLPSLVLCAGHPPKPHPFARLRPFNDGGLDAQEAQDHGPPASLEEKEAFVGEFGGRSDTNVSNVTAPEDNIAEFTPFGKRSENCFLNRKPSVSTKTSTSSRNNIRRRLAPLQCDKCGHMQKRIKRMRSGMEGLKKKHHELAKQDKQQKDQIKHQQSELAKYKAQVRQQQEQIKNKNDVRTAQNDVRTVQKKMINELQVQLKNQQAAVTEAEALIEKKDDQITNQQSELAKSKALLEKRTKGIQILKKALETQEEEAYKEKNRRFRKYRLQLEHVREEERQEKDELRDQLEQSRLSQVQLEVEVQQLTAENQELKNRMAPPRG